MGVPLRLLLIEDSEDDVFLVMRELRNGGYDPTYLRVETRETMCAALEQQEWDLVISDFSMPHFSGSDALELLRSYRLDTPFIFVSGTIGEESAVAALKVGAQDYLMKSNLKRLVPAIQRELRDAGQRRERKRLEQQVQHLQKFEAIGRLAGGIAHDFNNVLGAISGWAELASGEAQPGTRLHDRLQKILNQTVQAAGMTAQLLAFARRQVLQPRKIDLSTVVEQGTALLRSVIGEQIEIRILPSPRLHVILADPSQIEQVLMNLCLNARDAMPKGGRLTIETQNVEVDGQTSFRHPDAQPGSYVLLTVSDTGIGMDAVTVGHIFEPFFTTKELGSGTGLGLATVYGVVKQHGGFIDVQSQPEHGSTFRIYLPAEKGAAEQPRDERGMEPRTGSETILLAEDHEGLRESIREILEALGYRVIAAADGIDAVELFQRHSDRIDVTVLDVVMPRLDGLDAYSRMLEIRPGLPVIFTTGYTHESASLASLREAGAFTLQKPYSPCSLTHMVGNALDRTRPS